MKRLALLCCGGLALIIVSAFVFLNSRTATATSAATAAATSAATAAATFDLAGESAATVRYDRGFEVQILVDGRSLEEYAAHGRSYVQAIAGAEYEVRIRNPLPYRVAVALSVDGLNTIDARRTIGVECEQVGDRTVRQHQHQRLADEFGASAALLFYFRARLLRRQAGPDCESRSRVRSVLSRATALPGSRDASLSASASAL